MIVNIIGVPVFWGSDKKGVDLGPNDLRAHNLEKIIEKHNHTVYDLGNIYIKDVEESLKYSSHEKMKYFKEISDYNNNLAHAVYCSLKAGCFPLVIGGDHSLGLGSISGASKFFDNLGVVWIDAHGDLNTYETSLTGNVHGMPLSAAMGFGFDNLVNLYFQGKKVEIENVFIIGARDLDADEVLFVKDHNLNVWTTEYIQTHGIEKTLKEVLHKFKERNLSHIHLSFDIDVLDKALVPGTGTPVENGLTVEEAKAILKCIIETELVSSMDVVELNSLLDSNGLTLNTTIDIIDYCFSLYK
ncbi:MAG: arginase [Clostridiales bacterium]|uniref:arginase n=1 Tax=Clostridium sp. N3C TaxID=1776758 RepID=UPI00092DFC52|nr:arginase [Clostridium sp. N3C]NLZ49008.1 arginase [Clostridiales bacterium]SCN23297.1 Arginase [Clostridium sp. N3C]